MARINAAKLMARLKARKLVDEDAEHIIIEIKSGSDLVKLRTMGRLGAGLAENLPDAMDRSRVKKKKPEPAKPKAPKPERHPLKRR